MDHLVVWFERACERGVWAGGWVGECVVLLCGWDGCECVCACAFCAVTGRAQKGGVIVKVREGRVVCRELLGAPVQEHLMDHLVVCVGFMCMGCVCMCASLFLCFFVSCAWVCGRCG